MGGSLEIGGLLRRTRFRGVFLENDSVVGFQASLGRARSSAILDDGSDASLARIGVNWEEVQRSGAIDKCKHENAPKSATANLVTCLRLFLDLRSSISLLLR
jgi:hypothetical protein